MKSALTVISALFLSVTACDQMKGAHWETAGFEPVLIVSTTLNVESQDAPAATDPGVAQHVPGTQEIAQPQGVVTVAEESMDLQRCPDGREAEIFEGDFTVETDDDLSGLENVSAITGDLIINIPEVTNVSLDCLQKIEGVLFVQPFPACVVSGITETVVLPALTSIGGMQIQFNEVLHTVNLPSLRVSRGHIKALVNPALTTFNAPLLTRIAGDLSVSYSPELAAFDFPELRWAKGKIELMGSGVVTSISLAKLNSAGSLTLHSLKELKSVDVSSLESVVGTLSFKKTALKTANLPKLEEAGGVSLSDLDSCGSVVAPQLRWIGEGGFALSDNAVLSSAWLPQLEESLAYVFFTYNDSLEELYLPALTKVGNNVVNSNLDGSFSVSANASIHTVHLPVLKAVRGKFSVQSNPSLEEFDVPVLNTVGWEIRVTGNEELVAFSFAKLSTVRGIEVLNNASLETFTITPLYKMTGLLEVSKNPSLTSFDMHNLGIARGVTIHANESYSSLSLPGLTRVGDFGLFVTNNPSLTDLGLHKVEEVESKLKGLTISGNESLNWFVLPGLTRVLRMTIEDNPSLTGFCIPLLVDAGTEEHWKHPIFIRNNDSLGWFAMPSLETIPSLFIEGNEVLSDIEMHNLKRTWDTYHRDIVIKDNPSLTSLPFSGLEMIGGTLEIQGNPKLKNIPMAKLESIGGDVLIDGNESLPQCELESLMEEMDVQGQVEIDANNEDCVCEELDEGLAVVCE